MGMEPQWLDWAKRLQAIAQNGLTYATDPFDQERYEGIRRIAAEMMANGSDAGIGEILGLFSDQQGYATPKVDVRGVVFQDDKILLVHERRDGGWTLPGGWADVSESPRECVEKEVREEAGYTIRATKLLAVYDRSKHPHEPPFAFHIYKLFFLCEITGGAPKESVETSGIGFFDEGSLPPLSLSRVLPRQIERMFDHARHPEWPTDFD